MMYKVMVQKLRFILDGYSALNQPKRKFLCTIEKNEYSVYQK